MSGYFCSTGSSAAQQCTPGSYCAADYLAAPSGQCDEGYYCTLAAVMPNPTDGTTGKIPGTTGKIPDTTGKIPGN